ncbi:hypothetical protein K438DRAFT_2002028 [Mycena galopus ATCC 62051]|nr:hypothetical protein K438DRAFT_2002028 [Mycena galopus ATCC 62051]
MSAKWRRSTWLSKMGISMQEIPESETREAVRNLHGVDSYGCATTWMHHAIRDNNTTEDVHLMFGVAHLLVGTCGSNHPCPIPVGTIKTNFRLNGFDLRAARAKYGPATSLTDYFASATPRIEMGDDVDGTTAVHALAISCDHPDCKGSSAPLVPDTIETLWPKILHINPETGTQTRLPIANSLTIDGGLGNSVVYELVGTISHDAHREHWTSKFLLGNTTFHYDDLNRGSLVAQGPVDLITAPDMTAVLWAYHRSSKVTETRKSFQETVVAYQKAFEEESNRPKSPPIDVPESPVPKANTGFALPVVPHADLDTPILNPAIFSPKVVASPPAQVQNSGLFNGAPFPIEGPGPDPLNFGPHLPPPTHKCTVCHSFCDVTFDIVESVKCGECQWWYHVKCITRVSEIVEPISDTRVCAFCEDTELDSEPMWTDALLGTYIMAQTTTDSHFYAARVASLTSAGAVRLEWYVDNIYTRHEQPLESEFLYTKEACAKAAAANADLTYFKDNVGVIRWPYRLLEDTHDVHEYNNIQISESLLHSRHAVIEILSGSAPHPIVHDYETWMTSAGQLTQENHANDFARKFFEARILPGDASLIEPHTEHVVQQICFPLSGENMDLRRRVIVLAPLLFQLVILCIYLRRSPADDEQIYFLTRIFDKSELKKINANDPLLGAKRGKVIRKKTIPDIVMNTPETSSSTN